MQKVLKRFYLIFSLITAIVQAILFINITAYKIDSSLSNSAVFITTTIIVAALSFAVVKFESSIFYNKNLSLITHSIILLLFPIFYVLETSQLTMVIIGTLILLTLIVKYFYYNTKAVKFDVNKVKVLCLIYLIVILSTTLINLFNINYIASIFLVMPLLFLETEFYFKIKLNKENSEYNYILSIVLVLLVFFLSYYSSIISETEFKIIEGFILPAIALSLNYVLFKMSKAKMKTMIDLTSIE